MAEPSLTEITNIAVDPERGTGTPAVVIDQREMVRNINQAAQFKAQNDWNKHLDFQKRLGDTLSDLNEVQKQEVMTEDREALQKDASELYDMILNNPGAFSGRKPQEYAKIQAKYGELSSKATESKMNNIYDKMSREYLLRNENLNNDDNKQVIEQFKSQPLGQRKAYNLNLPEIFDANAYAEGLKKQVTRGPLASTSVIGGFDKDGNVLSGDQFIREMETTTIPFNDYISQWNASLQIQDDKRGQPIRRWAEKRYEKLPEDVKSKVTLEQFWEEMGKASFGGDRDEKGTIKDIITKTKDNIQANPNYLEDEKLAEERRQANQRSALGWANYGLDKKKFDNAVKSAGVPEDVASSAKTYAVSLVEKLKKLAGPTGSGVIGQQGMQSLTPEELKYLGSSSITDNKFNITPLSLDGREGGKTMIAVGANGNIQIIQGDKKTTIDASQIASNRLGEEITLSSGKEGFNFESLTDLYEDKESTTTAGGGVKKTAPAKAQTKVVKAKMPDGSIVTSDDGGKTWKDGNGKQVQ